MNSIARSVTKKEAWESTYFLSHEKSDFHSHKVLFFDAMRHALCAMRK
jgi:hypothetical protein